METLSYGYDKIYEFVYDYNEKELIFSNVQVDKRLNKFKEDKVLYESGYKPLLNKLDNITDIDMTVKFENEVKSEEGVVKYYIVKGKRNKLNQFIGVLIDDTKHRIMQQKTLQAEKLRSLGELAGGIAHDFNNQLMVILGSCELLKKNTDNSKTKKYLKSIETSAKNSAELIEKLLTFASVDKEPKELFNIVECVESTRGILKRLNEKVKIKHENELKEMFVFGNYISIQNVILNVCRNSIDAINGSGDVIINSQIVELNEPPLDIVNPQSFTQGNYVLIKVSDNGSGIEIEDINKIFDPFYTTKGFDKGSGLGLSTVLGTMERTNAIIGVESKVNQGTTVSLYFKLISKEKFAVEKIKKQIMLIDDDELVRDITSEILIELGYEVICFEGGSDAIDYYKYKFKEIDLVICDMMMPEMTGKEVLDNLLIINKYVKFVVLSGYSNESENMCNVIDYLKKPISVSGLSTAVEKALK